MDDLISRKAAIDAVNRALDRETLLNRLVRKVAIDAIRIVPPVRPEQEIIHCEECVYKKICSWKNQGAKFCSFGERGDSE